jgi:hypothetical protein
MISPMPVIPAPKISPPPAREETARYPWWRPLTLCALLIAVAPPDDVRIHPFLFVWILSFLPYFVVCAFVLATRPAPGKWRWLELAIILLGALILRAMLLPLPPGLSHDSWRYLWDARVTLHGFSPYVYAPADPQLAFLRDNVLYANSRFRTVPTIYPPGAEGIYLLSYLLAPANLFFMKGLFVVFDLITCGALVLLLQRRGLDPRRAILYAWSPLPIVEFAVQGHVDVVTLMFTILAVVSLVDTSMRGRILTGVLVGIATLTKIYPILLLVVIVPDLLRETRARALPLLRRLQAKDYALLIACLLTIAIGYIPYLILGHGQISGYFFTYANEQGQNAGITQVITNTLGFQYHVFYHNILAFEHIVAALLMLILALIVFIQRLRARVSVETGILLLFGGVLSVSSHVFPWYTTTLLLWVPLLLAPLWTSRRRLNGAALAVFAIWYFTSTSLLGYFFNSGPDFVPDWTPYYRSVYLPVMLALVLAALIGLVHQWKKRKGNTLENRV